jgi:predicted AlkP superfamily pyrophosphatase or phosphodiesterase
MKGAGSVKDGSWYGGTPLWVLAERQQMLTASFYWVGSEAAIRGTLPTYYYGYNEKIPVERRIEIVLEWLQKPDELRPHLICFYFPEVDHAGHDYGPDSPQTRNAVRRLDRAVRKLVDAVKTTGLPVNFVFVGDHGMTNIDTKNTLRLPAVVDSSKFYIPRGFELLALYAKDKNDIEPTYHALKKEARHYSVYLRNEMPARLHYSEKDDSMQVIGDILLVPHWPKKFYHTHGPPGPGAHGFDPYLVKDMHTVFYAWGPNIRPRMRVAPTNNVDVYPVITRILGLPHEGKIDGSADLASKIVTERISSKAGRK